MIVTDLIDIVLIISRSSIDIYQARESIVLTFKRRNTHEIQLEMEYPPESWNGRFEKMAEKCGLKENISEAFEMVHSYYKQKLI